MSKEDHIQKVDLRVPIELFGKIEEIAVKTNQPFTPRSKNTKNPKPVVTSVILTAIELALSKLENEIVEELLEGKSISNLIISDSLEDRIFNRLEKRLEVRLDEIIEARLEKLASDKNFNAIKIRADLINEEINESAIELIEGNSEVVNEEIKESAIELDKEDNSEPNLLPKEIITEDVSALEDIEDNSEPKEMIEVKESIAPSEVKSFDEAVIEIKRLKEQGNGNTAIAKELTGKYFTKQGKTNWSDTQVRRLLN